MDLKKIIQEVTKTHCKDKQQVTFKKHAPELVFAGFVKEMLIKGIQPVIDEYNEKQIN